MAVRGDTLYRCFRAADSQAGIPGGRFVNRHGELAREAVTAVRGMRLKPPAGFRSPLQSFPGRINRSSTGPAVRRVGLHFRFAAAALYRWKARLNPRYSIDR